MPPAEAADPWSEVWDAYEARHAGANPAPVAAPLPPQRAPRAPPRRRRRMLFAAGLALGLGGLAGPARPLLGMAGLVLWPDVPVLLSRLDLPPGLAAPPLPAPRGASPPEAERYLAMLARDVAEGWRDPAALRRGVLARQGLPPRPHAALRPLERVRSLRPLGWGVVRMEIGPVAGPGGVGLDLAWQATGWRVTRLQLLDRPA